MSFALAIGLLLLIGGWLLLSLLAFALFAPSFGLLVLIERFAAGHTDIEDIEDA